ncbi:restriction endonuclease subunit S [Glutamicibacter sp.]|uniref:restriction endonuclease subunit S n=1 Tax=Glutamicibacter sp. TaxID=1931995 RepID=UPI0028BDABB7|nr:restriction endonuclease subunit S [Glutamicibacter sp.]
MIEWGTSTVGDEFFVQLGKRVDAAVARGVPKVCINNRGVRWGYVDTSVAAVELLNEADIRDLRLIEGDVLVCEGGEIGRSSVWRGEVPEAYYLNTLHRLRPRQGYDPELAAAFLEYFVATGTLHAIVGKSSLAHLTKENLLRVPLPVPPPVEQRAIATALRSVDDLIRALERLIAKKRDIKQGLMQELLTGRTRLPGFTEEWEQEKLGAIATMGSGGTPPSSIPKYYGGSIPWVSISDMTKNGKYIEVTENTLTEDGLASSAAKLYEPDVVLYAMYASLGECSLAVGRVASSQAILGINAGPRLDREFLYYSLQYRKGHIKLLGQQGTQSNLNAGMVRNFELDLPSIEEQVAIVVVLKDVDDELLTLERQLASARAVKVGMMQELLTGRTRLQEMEEA